MRVGPVQLDTNEAGPRLWAPVELAGVPGLPEALEFRVRSGALELGPASGDAFAVGLLPLAMHRGEALHVEAPVSVRLAHGLRSYQDILHTWWPEDFHRVPMHFAQLEERATTPRPAGVGCGFSGGVDSFFTALSHLPGSEPLPAYRVSHALFINGMDKIDDFDGAGTAQRLHAQFRPVLESHGVNLVLVESNLRRFRNAILPRQPLVHSYLSSLGAWPHAAAANFGRYFIAGHSTYAYGDIFPHSAHVAVDHHLGTDQLEIIHHGAHATRAERIEFLAGFAALRSTLRVCSRAPEFHPHTGGIWNCGRCEKCRRTLVTLDILGVREQFSCFPPGLDLARLQGASTVRATHAVFLADNLALALRHGRRDWQKVLRRALAIARKRDPQAEAPPRPWWQRARRALRRRLRAA